MIGKTLQLLSFESENPIFHVFSRLTIASREDEMNDKYNEKLCTSNEVIQWNEWGDLKCLQKPTIVTSINLQLNSIFKVNLMTLWDNFKFFYIQL